MTELGAPEFGRTSRVADNQRPNKDPGGNPPDLLRSYQKLICNKGSDAGFFQNSVPIFSTTQREIALTPNGDVVFFKSKNRQMQFSKVIDIVNSVKCQQGEDVIVYLSNKDKRENKYDKFNYPVLIIGKLQNKKLVSYDQEIGKQLIALADNKVKGDYVKIVISPKQEAFKEFQYNPYRFYEVKENEELKLKLAKRLEAFKKIDYSYEVDI